MGCEMNTKGTVFVTGGASGIGLAIARSLLDEGWRVVIADRAQGNLDKARGSFGEHDARLAAQTIKPASVARTMKICIIAEPVDWITKLRPDRSGDLVEVPSRNRIDHPIGFRSVWQFSACIALRSDQRKNRA